MKNEELNKNPIQQLFRQHYRQMYRLAILLLHDDAESKDVVHDVFVRLLSPPTPNPSPKGRGKTRGAPTPNPSPKGRGKQGEHPDEEEAPTVLRADSAEAFLLASVRNRCLNVIRNRKIQERIQRLYLLDQETNAASERQLREEIQSLNEAIDLLQPPVCRDIVMRHFRDGLTFKEIASELQVSETTVYKHLRRAMESLRVQLKNPKNV